MKLRGSHKWLALAAAALAVPLIGGQPVSAAQPSITLSSSSAPPTGRVSVKGIRGFQPAEMVELYFDSTDVDYTIAAGTGGFGFTAVNIPTSAAPGPHWITAVGRTSGASAQASVWVSGAWQLAGQTDTGERFNKFENVISRTNATSLQPSWTGERRRRRGDPGDRVRQRAPDADRGRDLGRRHDRRLRRHGLRLRDLHPAVDRRRRLARSPGRP